MALTSPGIYSELLAARHSGLFPFAGVQFEALALGVAHGLAGWAVGQPQNVGLRGIATGAIGAGTIGTPTTRLVLVPNIPGMQAALAGVRISGPLSSSLAIVISRGVSNAFGKYAQYAGVVAGVGTGLDITKVVFANAPSLQALLYAALVSQLGGRGSMVTNLSMGLAVGIAQLVLTGTGSGNVMGVPGPTFGSGTSTSVVV